MVNLDADRILKLSACRHTDAAGRVCYAGPEVTRRIERLQTAADREGEAQRGLMQDYAAEFDRQTGLYHQRRQAVILSAAKNPTPQCRNYVGKRQNVEWRYVWRRNTWPWMPMTTTPGGSKVWSEEARLDFGVDCSGLYGTDLTRMPAELSALFIARLEQQESTLSLSTGERVFPQVARPLWLQVCGELWPAHIAGLRDSMASQLLSSLNHKSAVAQYVRRSNEAWREYWELVDAEFLSRLIAFPLSRAARGTAGDGQPGTESLLAQEVSSPGG